MCIFCGGQCGGVGEFLISMGLPFLVLFFFKIKNSLLRIKAKIFPGAAAAGPTEIKTCACCGKPPGECRALATGPLDPKTMELLEFEPQEKGRAQGVKGWLWFLCLNLTMIIPFSYLYQTNTALRIFYTPGMQLPIALFKQSLLYNIISISSWILLAIFSCYAGLSLWGRKRRAVKIAKGFLITQLLIMFILIVMQPFMEFSLDGNGNSVLGVTKAFLPFLLYFIVWYLYLSFSARVCNTYGGSADRPVGRESDDPLQVPNI